MARLLLRLEVDIDQTVTPFACIDAITKCLHGHDHNGRHTWPSAVVTALQPHDMGSHGEHGMAYFDITCAKCGKQYKSLSIQFSPPCCFGVDSLGQPKERSTDCSCGMGVGAQPSAHFPDCGAYIGSVILYHGIPGLDQKA